MIAVERNSTSWRASLRPGDVIREINRNAVENADQAVALSEENEEEVVLLRIWRNGSTLFLAIDESNDG